MYVGRSWHIYVHWNRGGRQFNATYIPMRDRKITALNRGPDRDTEIPEPVLSHSRYQPGTGGCGHIQVPVVNLISVPNAAVIPLHNNMDATGRTLRSERLHNSRTNTDAHRRRGCGQRHISWRRTLPHNTGHKSRHHMFHISTDARYTKRNRRERRRTTPQSHNNDTFANTTQRARPSEFDNTILTVNREGGKRSHIIPVYKNAHWC